MTLMITEINYSMFSPLSTVAFHPRTSKLKRMKEVYNESKLPMSLSKKRVEMVTYASPQGIGLNRSSTLVEKCQSWEDHNLPPLHHPLDGTNEDEENDVEEGAFATSSPSYSKLSTSVVNEDVFPILAHVNDHFPSSSYRSPVIKRNDTLPLTEEGQFIEESTEGMSNGRGKGCNSLNQNEPSSTLPPLLSNAGDHFNEELDAFSDDEFDDTASTPLSQFAVHFEDEDDDELDETLGDDMENDQMIKFNSSLPSHFASKNVQVPVQKDDLVQSNILDPTLNTAATLSQDHVVAFQDDANHSKTASTPAQRQQGDRREIEEGEIHEDDGNLQAQAEKLWSRLNNPFFISESNLTEPPSRSQTDDQIALHGDGMPTPSKGEPLGVDTLFEYYIGYSPMDELDHTSPHPGHSFDHENSEEDRLSPYEIGALSSEVAYEADLPYEIDPDSLDSYDGLPDQFNWKTPILFDSPLMKRRSLPGMTPSSFMGLPNSHTHAGFNTEYTSPVINSTDLEYSTPYRTQSTLDQFVFQLNPLELEETVQSKPCSRERVITPNDPIVPIVAEQEPYSSYLNGGSPKSFTNYDHDGLARTPTSPEHSPQSADPPLWSPRSTAWWPMEEQSGRSAPLSPVTEIPPFALPTSLLPSPYDETELDTINPNHSKLSEVFRERDRPIYSESSDVVTREF
jgi:hypothetical protein